MWEEVPTPLIAAAAIILAIAAVVLGYFNPQAPAHYAHAEVAPIVKPYNSTFVYIGAVGRDVTSTTTAPASDSLPVLIQFEPSGQALLAPFYPNGITPNYGYVLYKQTYDLTGAYNYTLAVQIDAEWKLIKTYVDWWTQAKIYVYNVTAVGQLMLYLFGMPVAYDAFYGFGNITVNTPLPPPIHVHIKLIPIGIPTQRELPGGFLVSKLEGNNTLVTYVNKTIQVIGCGENYTYYKLEYIGTSTVNGGDYVRDPTGQLCSLPYTTQNNQTGWLYCNNEQNQQRTT